MLFELVNLFVFVNVLHSIGCLSLQTFGEFARFRGGRGGYASGRGGRRGGYYGRGYGHSGRSRGRGMHNYYP